MAMQRVSMRFARAPDGASWRAHVREITGADEIAVDGAGTATALALLARVADVDEASVYALTASDRDRVLAVVYHMTFGDQVRSSPGCAACGKPFDVAFSLAALMSKLDAGTRPGNGVVMLPDGRMLRVPDAKDELAASEQRSDDAVAALAAAAGVAAGDSVADASAALTRDAPIADLDLPVTCPECEHAQVVAFDLQSFLLQRLLLERRRLTAEVHTLASAYGWSLQDILAMPRRTRRRFIATVEEAERRAAGMMSWAPR